MWFLKDHNSPSDNTAICLHPKILHLTKKHKVNLKVRPFVSGRNGIFERLSWFLQIILKHLLRQVKSHVGNTEELLNRFHNCPSFALEGEIPVSFDVVSLYTNIDTEKAISTALQYSQNYNIHLYGLSCQDLNELLHLLLENNIFEYPVEFFNKSEA